MALFSNNLTGFITQSHFDTLHLGMDPKATRFSVELLPVHSQLLGESQLLSFPPLTDMLKFSGLKSEAKRS